MDHGLISVAIAIVAHGTLTIDTWLMSCRVLQRQVEFLVLDTLVQSALQRGCKEKCWVFLSLTSKNGLVSQHYLKMGFEVVVSDTKRGKRPTLWIC